MRVYVKGLDGASLCVECEKTDSLTALKASVAGAIDVESSLFSLSTGLRFLSEDANTIVGECGIEEDSTLYVNAELLGAAKKRKKKQYTKPKKIKHKKKKVKLAVLKYYKVDANNKVSRLRKECPSATCGPGIFMAKHHNRTNCGRCGMSYIASTPKE